MLNGHVGYKVCGNAFMCHKCEFDQMIEDEIVALDPVISSGARTVDGFIYPDTYYYHRGHGYAMVDYGGRIRVGLDDFSSRLVGLVDKVEVPRVGETIHQNEIGWEVSREGNTAEMFSPVEGIVSAINYKAVKSPELLNNSPYEKGWLYMLEPRSLKNNLKDLLYGEEAFSWAHNEIGRLRSMMADELGPTASAGGSLTRDIYGALREVGWKRLVGEFLLTSP
jgi:glycine cleavage system H lipoate-binding protein